MGKKNTSFPLPTPILLYLSLTATYGCLVPSPPTPKFHSKTSTQFCFHLLPLLLSQWFIAVAMTSAPFLFHLSSRQNLVLPHPPFHHLPPSSSPPPSTSFPSGSLLILTFQQANPNWKDEPTLPAPMVFSPLSLSVFLVLWLTTFATSFWSSIKLLFHPLLTLDPAGLCNYIISPSISTNPLVCV